MNGWDFSILWAAGQAVLQGRDPYTVANFFYPLPFAYLLVGFGIFPQQVAFAVWIGVNLLLLVYFFRRRFWQWLPYLPVFHMLSSGQIDFFLWSLERGIKPGWRGALFASIITLKPQAALILLPWHLLNWLRADRTMLARWLVTTGVIWGLPLLWQPGWLNTWLHQTSPLSVQSAGNAPGIFSLLKIFPDIWPVLAVIAVVIFVVGQFQSKEVARACAMLASPVGLFYSTMALIGTAPAWLLTPISLIAAVLSIVLSNFIPFAALPLAVLWWHVRHKQTATQPMMAGLTSPPSPLSASSEGESTAR
ncbi:MAG: DUF2029 domain-containing protein [Anaerolineae bacterium]|nr:DUF2029 domain-containing protein [Anaerolineae bacterium]